MRTSATVQQRTWVIYRFWDAQGQLLYVGQTERHAYVRWMEHLADKWWAPLIAAAAVDPQEYGSLPDVLRAEKALIKSHPRPHCNVEHNGDNPDRWLSPAHVVPVQRVRRPMARPEPVRARRRLTRWQRRALTVSGGWLATVLLTWIPLHADHPGFAGLKLAAVLVTVVALGLWMAAGRKRRRRRRVW